jgi:hypothetical protein
MRRFIILAGALCLTGCGNIVGPFQRPRDRVDDPQLTIAEQEQRGRDRYAYPDWSGWIAPRTNTQSTANR